MNFTQEMADTLKETNKAVIKHDVKLSEVCKTLGKIDKKMDKLNDKIDDNVKTYITRRMFMWVNGIIIAGIIILGGYMASINEDLNDLGIQVNTNTVCVENLKQNMR